MRRFGFTTSATHAITFRTFTSKLWRAYTEILFYDFVFVFIFTRDNDEVVPTHVYIHKKKREEKRESTQTEPPEARPARCARFAFFRMTSRDSPGLTGPE